MSIRTTLAATALTLAAVPALALAAGPAGAEGPAFSSPDSAASGTPIHVRSVDACPSPFHPDNYRYVAVQIAEQSSPNSSGVNEVLADVRPDGAWDLIIDAPEDVSSGSQSSYFIEAECWEVDLSAPNTSGSNPGTEAPNAHCAAAQGDPQKQHRLCYQPRKLRVTGEAGEFTAPPGDGGGSTTGTGGTGDTGGTGGTGDGGGGTSSTLPETLDLRTGSGTVATVGAAASSVSDDEAAARVRAYLEAQRELRKLMDDKESSAPPEVAFAPVVTSETTEGGGGLGVLPLAFVFALGGFTVFAAMRRSIARS